MPLCREPYDNREDWLAARVSNGNGDARIGASEAAACCGMSPWMSARELWELKTGRKAPKDLADNSAVSLGVRMEPVIRAFYQAQNPTYSVAYHPYDLLYLSERPAMFATLDGEVTDDKGRRGILEIKTATPSGAQGWKVWADGQIPVGYFIQILHQLSVTGWDFVDLCAALFSLNGDTTIRTYHFERSDHEEDIAWVVEQEEKLLQHIRKGTMPPAILTF